MNRTPVPAWTFALAALLLVPARGRAQEVSYPDTEPGRHARAYFPAYNDGEAAMRAFWQAHGSAAALKVRPVEARLEVWREMRDQQGALTPLRTTGAGDDFAEVLARTAAGGSIRIRFLCEPTAPHGLVALRVEDDGENDESAAAPAARRESTGPEPPPSDAAIVAALAAEVDSLSAAGAFSGAVLLEKDGTPLFQRACGFASRKEGVRNTLETRFNLGSINKIFTSVAIHQLAQIGKLDLNATIDRYLPDYPKEKGRRITVRQLLDHRGGVPDFFNQRYTSMDHSKIRNLADWVALVRDEPLRFDPGTRQEYSNGGYALLGMIVQRVSGEDYYDYVRDHIYAPSGMAHSAHEMKDAKTEGRATGYTRHRDGLRPQARAEEGEAIENTDGLPGRGSPAGGGYSTAGDLARFARALRSGKLLDTAGTERVYGGGLGIAGGSPGVNALLEVSGPWTLVVLANLDPPAAERFAKTTGRMIRRSASPQGREIRDVIRAGERH